MLSILDKTASLSPLISPRIDVRRPIYNWHPFKHSYSKSLVDAVIKEFELKPGSWVMDSFCGGGTTLLACKEAGINSAGFDILPFSVFLSTVKTGSYDTDQLLEERKKFAPSKNVSLHFSSLSTIPIAKKAFTTSTRTELTRIKERIEKINDLNTKNFYNLGLLSIIESVSNTSKAGGFLRIVNRKIPPKMVHQLFFSKIDRMIADTQQFNCTYKHKAVKVSVKGADARQLRTNRKFDAIITSPPYPNRHDYTRIYSLEMLFDFVSNNEDLKSIRYRTLRSHVEAKRIFQSIDYERPKRLAKIIKDIQQNGVNNPMVVKMIDGYFEDMFLALKQMSNSLVKGGKIALVVSNVRFAGISVPVDELLAEIGSQVGLTSKAIWIARYRGNSSQQMKEYNRYPSRESIVVWEK